MVYSFYFLCVGSTWNECNSLRGWGEKSEGYCYSESMSVRHFYLLSHYISYGLFFLFSVCWLHVEWIKWAFGGWGGKGRNLLLARKVYRPEEKMIYCDNIMINLQSCRRLYRNKPQPSVPFPISFSNTTGIHSFWIPNTEKKNPQVLSFCIYQSQKNEKK